MLDIKLGGGGNYFWWEYGIIDSLIEKNLLDINKVIFHGISCGALVGVCILNNIKIDRIIESIFNYIENNNINTFLKFYLHMEKILDLCLPKYIHIKCNNKLKIYLLEPLTLTTKIIDNFPTREFLLETLIDCTNLPLNVDFFSKLKRNYRMDYSINMITNINFNYDIDPLINKNFIFVAIKFLNKNDAIKLYNKGKNEDINLFVSKYKNKCINKNKIKPHPYRLKLIILIICFFLFALTKNKFNFS